MAGTKEGGKRAAMTNKTKYGIDFYARLGSIGGKLSNNGGFASLLLSDDGLTGRERAAIAGSKGGKISKRPKSKVSA